MLLTPIWVTSANLAATVVKDKFVPQAQLCAGDTAAACRSELEVTQSQVAATLALLLGEDYAATVPEAGKPIADVLKSAR